MDTIGMLSNAVKREVEDGRMEPTNTLGIDVLNLEKFKLSKKEGKKRIEIGTANIAEIIEIKDFLDHHLESIFWAHKMMLDYHKDSPKKIWDELEKNEGRYTVGLNLEPFMKKQSNSKKIAEDIFIPDNYHLAEKVFNKFKKSGGDTKGIEDISFRDTAMWEITSKARAKKFIKFIQKTYIDPFLNGIMDEYNVKKVHFTNEAFEFEFND